MRVFVLRAINCGISKSDGEPWVSNERWAKMVSVQPGVELNDTPTSGLVEIDVDNVRSWHRTDGAMTALTMKNNQRWLVRSNEWHINTGIPESVTCSDEFRPSDEASAIEYIACRLYLQDSRSNGWAPWHWQFLSQELRDKWIAEANLELSRWNKINALAEKGRGERV